MDQGETDLIDEMEEGKLDEITEKMEAVPTDQFEEPENDPVNSKDNDLSTASHSNLNGNSEEDQFEEPESDPVDSKDNEPSTAGLSNLNGNSEEDQFEEPESDPVDSKDNDPSIPCHSNLNGNSETDVPEYGAIPANATFHGSYHTSNVGRKPALGQSCSLKTLVADGILQAGREVLTIEYMGTKFIGDLRRDGTIVMRGPDGLPHVYATPSAWANHCCKLINPESKPGSAWSAIRFKGKRLDSFKLKWYRKQKKPPVATPQLGDTQSMNNHFVGNGDIHNSVHNFSSPLFGHNYMPYRQDLRGLNTPQQAGPFRAPIFQKNIGGLHRPSTSNHQQRMPLIQQKLHIHNPLSMPDGTGGGGPILSVGNNFMRDNSHLRNKKLIETMLLGQTQMDADCWDVVTKSMAYSDFDTEVVPGEHVITYEQLGTRGTHNPNVMVKCVPFTAIDRIQPFNVTVSTNALLLIDFHSHLVTSEVVGYLAGTWDLNQHNLTISQAFPCRTKLNNDSNVSAIEEEIRQEIERRKLTVVGWYHSHQGKYSNHPTLRDIQNQIDYQITMKESAGGYLPCVGLICSPHDTRIKGDMTPTFQMYWVMPPPEHLTTHYGRPMQMIFSVVRDLFLTQDLLLEMRLLANHYQDAPDMIDFKTNYSYDETVTYLQKLSRSVKPKLPKDLQESEYPEEPEIWKAAVDHFWKFLKNLVVEPSALPSDTAAVAVGTESKADANDSANDSTPNANADSEANQPMDVNETSDPAMVANNDASTHEVDGDDEAVLTIDEGDVDHSKAKENIVEDTNHEEGTLAEENFSKANAAPEELTNPEAAASLTDKVSS